MNFSLTEYLEELRPLINVDCGTYTTNGIESIASQCEAKFQAMSGWNVKRIDCGPAGVGLEIRNKPESEHNDVMLIGHMDTVFPIGTAALRPMSVDTEKAYGPGVADMKSGLLNIVYAMRNLNQEVLNKLSICICMNPDEEKGSLDSVEWIQSVARNSKNALVVEAARADGGLVKARKGMARYKITIKGKAAHSGNEPEKGRSAITELANWILTINEMTNLELGTSLNVGVVSGGSGANIVAEHAEAVVDVRFWCNDAYDTVHNRLSSLAENSFVDGVTNILEREAYKPSMVTSPQSENLMALVDEAANELSIDINWKEVGGGSDANNVAVLGIPTIDGMGPIGAGFHTDQEYLLLESIEPRIKMLMRVLEKIAL